MAALPLLCCREQKAEAPFLQGPALFREIGAGVQVLFSTFMFVANPHL